jgi:anti-anti-sigma factor
VSEQPSMPGTSEHCLVAAPGPVEAAVGVLCACRATSFSSPAGEIIVLQVAGDVDLLTLAVLQAALTDGLARRPCHLIVDIAEMTFCSGKGMALLVMAGSTAAESGTAYAVTAASRHINRIWSLLWPGRDLPDQYPTAADGVLAAMTHQPDRRHRDNRSARTGRAVLRVVGDDPDREAAIMDSWLVERARTGDLHAYRVLVHRHRDRMYRIATHMLETSPDTGNVTQDVAIGLRTILAGFIGDRGALVGPPE